MKARHSSQKIALFCLKQRACLVVVLSMLTGVAAVGQVDRAVLEGTVIDPSGAAIAGAHVKILAVDTGLLGSILARCRTPEGDSAKTKK